MRDLPPRLAPTLYDARGKRIEAERTHSVDVSVQGDADTRSIRYQHLEPEAKVLDADGKPWRSSRWVDGLPQGVRDGETVHIRAK